VTARSPAREEFLRGLLVTAIENYGYGFFLTDEYVWDVAPAQAYAVIVDPDDDSRRWRVDIDTIARGLAVIRNAEQVTEDGETLRVNAEGQRLYFDGRLRDELLVAETSGEAGDVDVVSALAVLECALFGHVVYA
jgi:hypothetical protein